MPPRRTHFAARFSVALIIEYLANPSEKAGNVKFAQNVLGIGHFLIFWRQLVASRVGRCAPAASSHRALALPDAEKDDHSVSLLLRRLRTATRCHFALSTATRDACLHFAIVLILVILMPLHALVQVMISSRLNSQASGEFVRQFRNRRNHAYLRTGNRPERFDTGSWIRLHLFWKLGLCSLIDACGEPVSQIFEEYQEGFPSDLMMKTCSSLI